jgi:hypothetical protein
MEGRGNLVAADDPFWGRSLLALMLTVFRFMSKVRKPVKIQSMLHSITPHPDFVS